MQVPGAVCLTSEEWGPESGLVTAAMKLKRRPLQVIWNILGLLLSCNLFCNFLQERYQEDINRMYGN